MTAPALPKMEPVQSSNILEVGHDGEHLLVRFRNGGLWRYRDFARVNYDEMKQSGSVGKYFHEFVKPNHAAEKVSS